MDVDVDVDGPRGTKRKEPEPAEALIDESAPRRIKASLPRRIRFIGCIYMLTLLLCRPSIKMWSTRSPQGRSLWRRCTH